MVTPVEDEPELMREHSYAGIRNTAVHEGYPGHHLQLTAGFSADPKTKFVQLTDQIWRACRILIDIDLHTGKMAFDEAVEFLVKESGMERSAAIAEVKRYTYTPGYQLSYLFGKHRILQLRKRAKKTLGKRYSDKFFHDTILYAGSPSHEVH